MKRTVLILSLTAPVLLLAVGGFFFAASGFGIDIMLPPTSPRRIVGTLIGYIPGLGIAIFAQGLSLAATARSRQTVWFVGLLVWPVVPIVAGVLMVTGTVGLSDSWWLAVLFVPLATLIYSLIGPKPLETQQPHGVQETIGRPPATLAPFLAFVSVLALVTLLGVATLVRGAPPFFPVPIPTATPGPPVLRVDMGTGTANCATGSYPTVTVTNTSKQTVSWSTRVNDAGITVTPPSGSLDAGASTTVTISGQATTPTFFTITFIAQGRESLEKIACISK